MSILQAGIIQPLNVSVTNSPKVRGWQVPFVAQRGIMGNGWQAQCLWR